VSRFLKSLIFVFLFYFITSFAMYSEQTKNSGSACELRLNSSNQTVLRLSKYNCAKETDSLKLVLYKSSISECSDSDLFLYELNIEYQDEIFDTRKKSVDILVREIREIGLAEFDELSTQSILLDCLCFCCKEKQRRKVFRVCEYPPFCIGSKDKKFNKTAKKILKKFDKLVSLYAKQVTNE